MHRDFIIVSAYESRPLIPYPEIALVTCPRAPKCIVHFRTDAETHVAMAPIGFSLYNGAMKRIVLAFALIAGFLAYSPAFAREAITSFDTILEIRRDSSLAVEERIQYDFGDARRHGIFRTIPVRYAAQGGDYALRLSGISVVNERGRNYRFGESSSGRYIKLKIGDPDVLVTGRHTYIIRYTVQGAINYFDSRDEFYWNATGDEWPVTIGRASARILLPEPIERNLLQKDCFIGSRGSTAHCSGVEYLPLGSSGVREIVFSHGTLAAGEGLTVVTGFPKGVVKKVLSRRGRGIPEPAPPESRLVVLVRQYWTVLFPILIFFGLLCLWYTRGRDPRGKRVIVARYDAPDQLTPGEVGTLVDEKANPKDLTAEIMYLAVRGYLKIKRFEKKGLVFTAKDYELEKLREPDDLSNVAERKLMERLFGEGRTVTISSLKQKFSEDAQDVMKEIYRSLTVRGYFNGNPRTVRNIFRIVGIGVLVVGYGADILFGPVGGINIELSGIFIFLFGFIMPARTRKGVLAKEHIEGLRRYLLVAEKDRLAFHNAPEKNPQLFERFLPYAMALGVEKEWAKQFEGIYLEPPRWYSGPAGPQFNAGILAASLGDFSSFANKALTVKPSSSGFGGDGFGGGGGGSW